MKRSLLVLLAAATPALADDDALERCRAIKDPALRLACYDAIALPAPGTPAAAPTPGRSAAPGTSAVPPRETPAQFGLPRRADAELSEIRGRIPGRFQGWGPATKIRLDNGQVWQISDGSSRPLDVENPKVTVHRGVLGAFYLQVEGTNETPRVRRVQ